MKENSPFLNSPYFKRQPFLKKLKIRWSRFMFTVYCKLDSNITGKFRHGWKYNGQDSPTNE